MGLAPLTLVMRMIMSPSIVINDKTPVIKDFDMNSLPVLDTEEAADFLHMTAQTLRFWRHKGTGPRSFRMGAHKVFYKQEDLEAWFEEQYNTPNPRTHSVA